MLNDEVEDNKDLSIDPIRYYERYSPVDEITGKTIDIAYNPKIEVDSERLITMGFTFTNAGDRKESLLDNLEMFKEASDALVDKMTKLIPDWVDITHHNALHHMNKEFCRAYRAWRRARAGIDSTLATLAADNQKRIENDISKG